MNRLVLGLIASLVLFTASPLASAPCKPPTVSLKPGMKVIAALAGPNWAEATITKITGEQIMVKYADGGLGGLGRQEVAPHPTELTRSSTDLCINKGDTVLAPAQGTTWRSAKVVNVTGEELEIKFVDGKTKTMKASGVVRQGK